MAFVKVVKNKAYFKRYQTKFRRRREGKTDYYARKRMVMQDKNKYAARKYRLVVRLHARQVCCQVVYSTIDHDVVLASAYSNELSKRYGLKVGLKNYAAAYATGLLLARRLLQKTGLDETYPGVEEVTGEVNKTTGDDGKDYYVSQVDEERRPFKCFLDVGIRSTTTGHRVFAAMKGASDGGLNIPHNEKRFPGYDREEGEFDASAMRDRIMGAHIANYMRELQEEEPEVYAKRFSGYIRAGVAADDVEGMIEAVHAAIRADPSAAEKKAFTPDKKYKKRGARLTLAERQARVAAKKEWRAKFLIAAQAADDSDSDEDSDDEDED